MLLEKGSDDYEELFGALADTFTSKLPPYDVLVVAQTDPSFDPKSIDETTAISDQIGSRGVIQRQGVDDLQSGTRHMLRHIATRVDVGLEGATKTSGVLAQQLPAIENVVESMNLGTQLDAAGVQQALGVADSVGVDGLAGKVAFGVGMTALSAMGPVGMAAAAIIGFATFLFNAFRSSKAKEQAELESKQAAAYELMPPLQEPRNEADEYYVQSVLMTIMESGSWTRLFSPRFDPKAEWVPAPRKGGYGLAPGSRKDRSPDEFGVEQTVFKSSGGVGFIPGRNEITSVVQVSLDPKHATVEAFYNPNTATKWPIKQAMVTDVGQFYANTGRLTAIAWSWVTQQEASLHLYKVHVGDENTPDEDSLHYQWREYCAGGLRFLMEVNDDWYGGKQRLGDKFDRGFLFGSAIGCAIGAWRCAYIDGKWHPSVESKERFDIRRVYNIDSEYGCIGLPGLVNQKAMGDLCYVTMYETQIRDTLIALRERQFYYLRHSLACAYVRKEWDAFRCDKALRDKLGEMRTLLLTHPDRKLVNLDDVPRDETHDGRNWYNDLVAAGAGTQSKSNSFIIGSIGTIEAPSGPAPRVPGGDAPMPFSSQAAPKRQLIRIPGQGRTPTWKKVLAGAGAVGLVGLGAYGFHRYRRRNNG